VERLEVLNVAFQGKTTKRTIGGVINNLLDTLVSLVAFVVLASIFNTLPILVPSLFQGNMAVVISFISVIISFVFVVKLYDIAQAKYRVPIFERITLKNIIKVITTFVGMFSIEAIVSLSSTANNSLIDNTMKHLHGITLVFGVVTIVIIAPLIEEVFFRGLMFQRLSNYGLIIQITIPTLIFTLCHGPQNIREFVAYLVMASAFMATKVWTGRLQYSIILHIFWNLLASIPLIATIV
jgi:membrane protease YdiL (CAAX protease family)